jgi:aspartate kinase
VTLDDSSRVEELRQKLAPYADTEVRSGQSIVAVVGRNLMHDSTLVAAAFAALKGIDVSMFSLGTSGLNLSIVVADADCDRAVRAVHHALFETPVGAIA